MITLCLLSGPVVPQPGRPRRGGGRGPRGHPSGGRRGAHAQHDGRAVPRRDTREEVGGARVDLDLDLDPDR